MSTEFFNDQWRIPTNSNQNKISNYSMEFDGTSDKIEFGDVNGFERTDKFSGSCWVYLTGGSINEYIISKQDDTTRKGYVFYVNSTRKLGVIISRDSSINIAQVLTTSNMPNNTWTHIAFTYDGSSTRAGIKLYINGVLQTLNYYGDANITGSIVDATLPFQISGRDGVATNAVNGQIDQVSIFDYELPATGTNSVATLYGGGTAVTNPMALSPKPIYYAQLGDQSVYNGANYLVPNNSLSGYVFRSVPLRTTNSVPTDTITSNINYTGTPGLPDPFTVSFWMKDSVVGNASVFFDHNASTYTTTTPKGAFVYFTGGKVLIYLAASYWRYYNLPSGVALTDNEWRNIVVYMNPLSNGLGKVWIDGTPLTLSNANSGSSANNFTAGFRFYLNNFGSNVMYFKDYEIDNAGATLLYNNGAPLLDTSTLAQAPDHWWKLNDDDTFNSGTSTWTINDYVGSENGTSVNMTSNNLVISDLDNTGSSVGYSPYALDFDGVDDFLNCGNANSFDITDSFSGSCWVYLTSTKLNIFMSKQENANQFKGYAFFTSTVGNLRFILGTPSGSRLITSTSTVTNNAWNHIAFTYDGSTNIAGAKLYMNGALQTTSGSGSISGSMVGATIPFQISGRGGSTTGAISGKLSNISVFNTELTSTEVTEIYNEGVPSNLNNFSGTAPVSWWQLGSNSSYNSGAWTCLDEIGTNNAVSAGGMTNDDIVDGPGYSASGIGTSSIDIKGDAPYSTANGLSENMDVLDRSTDVPS